MLPIPDAGRAPRTDRDARSDARCRGLVVGARERRGLGGRYAIGIDNHMSELPTSRNRSHADRRLHVLLRMQELRRSAAALAGRLLRFLFVWRHAVPADPRGARDRRQRQMLRSGLSALRGGLRRCRRRPKRGSLPVSRFDRGDAVIPRGRRHLTDRLLQRRPHPK
jgi:hypothetical protein